MDFHFENVLELLSCFIVSKVIKYVNICHQVKFNIALLSLLRCLSVGAAQTSSFRVRRIPSSILMDTVNVAYSFQSTIFTVNGGVSIAQDK